MKLKNRLDYLKKRHMCVRKKVIGSADRPRMCVRITNHHIYVQFMDDLSAVTLASCSTVQSKSSGHNINVARELGKRAAEVARERGITQVVFDRGGHAYHGRVKTIADAAREAGIKL
ncbi:MAG: 50S ribosomal protein L18 [Kiritimatiellia bacterium]|nr:50S ribosomal protein L18 [Lentisphaerota bacterium]